MHTIQRSKDLVKLWDVIFMRPGEKPWCVRSGLSEYNAAMFAHYLNGGEIDDPETLFDLRHGNER